MMQLQTATEGINYLWNIGKFRRPGLTFKEVKDELSNLDCNPIDGSILQALKRARYLISEMSNGTTHYIHKFAAQTNLPQNPIILAENKPQVSHQPNKENSHPENLIIRLCHRFHLIANQLLKRHNSRKTIAMDDEYDVQDLFHALLRVHFDDIRDEEWTPSYAGNSSRMDFLIKSEEIVVEVKKTRKGLGTKEVKEQLIIDTHNYEAHINCKTLICLVYDPELLIKNPAALENDLSKMHNGLKVIVIIVPKGL